MVDNFTPEQDQYLQLQQTRAYYQGLRQGIVAYAHWQDGVQYVGTSGRTLASAIAEVDQEEQQLIERFTALRQL